MDIEIFGLLLLNYMLLKIGFQPTNVTAEY